MNRKVPIYTIIIVCLVTFILVLSGCARSAPASPTAAPTAHLPTRAAASPTALLPTATILPATIDLSPETLPWWNDTTFYEIFVRSFYDSNGDGVGDFNGLTQKLDYLNNGDPKSKVSLGVAGIWLMPIFPSASYHGYDVTDYRTVNPDYGTMDDFKRFLSEAHKRGIKVIIDLVLNHTSSQNSWFLSAQIGPGSSYRDFYIWSEQDPGWKGPNGETVWHKSARGDYYYGYFGSNMPDLNYRNPAVTAEMNKVVQFWLKEVGVDGFRLDAAKYLIEDGKDIQNTQATHDWYQQFRAFYKSLNPNAVTVGEVWDPTKINAAYAQGNQLDLTFDFDLANVWVIGASSKDARPPAFQLKRDLPLYQPGQFATFLTNHDQPRVMSQVNGDVNKARVAAGLLLTSPGVPFIYYGEEIGMTGQKPDPQIRTPMQWAAGAQAGFTTGTPWELANPDVDKINVSTEDADPNSLLNFYRALSQLRREHSALRSSHAYSVETSNSGVYAVLRAAPAEAILVIINMASDPVSDCQFNLGQGPLKGTFSPTLLLGAGSVSGLSANPTGGFDRYQPLHLLPPYSVTLLSLKQ